MSTTIISVSVQIAQLMLVLAMAIVLIRIILGPRAQDRIIGLDTLYVNAMLLLVTFGISSGRMIYFEAALVVSMLGFVSTLALAKFLMRGEVIE